MQRLLIAAVLVATVAAQSPWQVHLAFAGPRAMAVSYVTNSSLAEPTVRFGVTPQGLTRTAKGSSTTYGTVWFHNVVLSDLNAGATYFYQIDGLATVYSFVTARAAGDAKPFTVGVIGDMGIMNSPPTYAQLLKIKNATDFFYHIGDVSYADDWFLRPGDDYEGSWNKWMNWMQPIYQDKAYMTLPGNHEVTCTEVTPFTCPPQQKNFTAYRHRFRMPWRESGGVENMWYSFDYGLAHFVQINTETDFPNAPSGPGSWLAGGPFGDQLGWLEKDLAAAVANRKQVPWIIVGGHRPWYSSGWFPCEACLKAFEPLFLKYNVDLYFAGHQHHYERLWPLGAGDKVVQKNYDNPPVPVYIVNGAAGNVEGHQVLQEAVAKEHTALLNIKDYGFGTLEVVNSTNVNWKFFRSADGALLDQITIRKQH